MTFALRTAFLSLGFPSSLSASCSLSTVLQTGLAAGPLGFMEFLLCSYYNLFIVLLHSFLFSLVLCLKYPLLLVSPAPVMNSWQQGSVHFLPWFSIYYRVGVVRSILNSSPTLSFSFLFSLSFPFFSSFSPYLTSPSQQVVWRPLLGIFLFCVYMIGKRVCR